MESEKKTYSIVICAPGASFSREWVQCLTNATSELTRDGHTVQLSFAYDALVSYARCRTLLCETTRGVDQKPFDGKLEYDYIMWIDSDVLFSAEHVRMLLRHDADIVSGAYLMQNNTHYPLVEDMNDADFLKDGHYKFLSRDDLNEKPQDELFDAEYVGMGFMLVKKGVFEALKYPYFLTRVIDFGTDGRVVEMASEDVSFCMNARDAGFTVHVDPAVRVPHLKNVPLI